MMLAQLLLTSVIHFMYKNGIFEPFFFIFSKKIKASEIFLSDSLTLKIYNSKTAGPTMSNFFVELPEEAYFKPKM